MLNHKGTKILETERLRLRKFKEEDAENMYNNWASDKEVARYLTWPAHSCVEASKQIIRMWMDDYKNKENYQWAIEMKEIGNIIGSISLLAVDNERENCEIGYCIGRAFWNKGIVTEALSAVIDFGFNEIGFERMAAYHHIDNPASGRVMEKCDLKYEGTLRKFSRDSSDNLVDCKYYSILKDEYLK
ncbi:MAG: GNAT family N-acetyltransferase [Clostridiaceae bacterium]